MPKKTVDVHCTKEEWLALEELTVNTLEDERVVERAQIVLACLRDEPLDAIANHFQVSRSMILRWRSRFIQEGLTGLWDRPRTGKPARYDDAFERRVLMTLQTPPPSGLARWDGSSLADALGASPDAIWRVLRRKGISLARQRVWNAPAQLSIAGEAEYVAGLFIAPPVWMIAMCLPYKRRQFARVTTRNKDAGQALEMAAKEQGQLTMQQVLQIMAQSKRLKRRENREKEEIIHFLDDMVKGLRPGERLSIQVLGDASTLEISSWMAAHQGVRFHFYSDMEEAREYLAECIKQDWITDDYSRLILQMMDYPADAAPFIWKRHNDHTESAHQEE